MTFMKSCYEYEALVCTLQFELNHTTNKPSKALARQLLAILRQQVEKRVETLYLPSQAPSRAWLKQT